MHESIEITFKNDVDTSFKTLPLTFKLQVLIESFLYIINLLVEVFVNLEKIQMHIITYDVAKFVEIRLH